MLLPKTIQGLKLTKNDLLAVKKQIQKDLGMTGLESDNIQGENLMKLWSELSDVLLNANEEDPEALRAFLYRVDVKEDAVTDAVIGTKDYIPTLTALVILRQWEKIQFRKNYSS